jgi:glutathione peroxidase-family protein
MYICVNVCLFVCLYVCMYVCMYACMYTYVSYVYTRTQTRTAHIQEFPCLNFKERLRQDSVSGVAVVAEIKVCV